MTGQRGSDGWDARAHVRVGLIFVVLLVGGVGGWAATARLDGAVIASGKLQMETRRQTVQHLDGGVVGKLLVREGDVVSAGDVLVRLDGTALQSELAVLQNRLYELIARRGRLETEQAGRERIEFDPGLVEAGRTDPDVQTLIDGQRDLFKARLKTLRREVEVIRERQAQIREQVVGNKVQIDAREHEQALIREELKAQRQLREKGLAEASRLLALEREAARLDGEHGSLIAENGRLKGEKAKLETELLRLRASRREEALAELRDFGFRELELQERQIALKEQISRLAVRAPMDGVVLDMAVHGQRSVIRAAEPILHIVPTDSAMVIEAKVDPTNIDSVHRGQEAVVRFSAFNMRSTPTLTGKISSVSPDALKEDDTGRSYYRAEVLLERRQLDKLEGRHLVPGMPVEVFIQTGERTPVEYLVKPIMDYFNRAMRDK